MAALTRSSRLGWAGAAAIWLGVAAAGPGGPVGQGGRMGRGGRRGVVGEIGAVGGVGGEGSLVQVAGLGWSRLVSPWVLCGEGNGVVNRCKVALPAGGAVTVVESPAAAQQGNQIDHLLRRDV